MEKYLDVIEPFRVVTHIKGPVAEWGDIRFKYFCKNCNIHAAAVKVFS